MNPFKAGKNEVSFQSEGVTLKGHLYLPMNFKQGQRLPAVVVTGSWTTVKEQMAGLYARKLAEQGFATLAFDFRFYGESGGQPRQYESPEKKIQDIKNAVTYLQSLPMIDPNRIGGLAVCASAGYMAYAVAEDKRIKSFVMVAPWLHDAELVRLIYGGEEGVRQRIEAGTAARKKYEQTGQVDYVVACSATDATAAMHGNFDYYLNPSRGAIPQWANKFAVMSWPEWLQFDPIKVAKEISVPTLFVHSDNAAIPDGARKFYNRMTAPKDFFWTQGTQFDFYDQEENVRKAVDVATAHFKRTL